MSHPYRMTVSLLALLAAAPQVRGQEAAPAAGGESLEEVVVTARKRAENLQEVPIAVTAFSGQQLAAQGVVKATDLEGQVPSLSVGTTSVFRDQPMWGIRGQRSDSFLVTQPPAVMTYFADVAQGHPAGFARTLFDIASVNVLKGPQGTLFGRNATGGAVVVEPNHPTDQFGGEVHLTLGSQSSVIGGGMINLPLGDKVALRVAGEIDKDSGLGKDLTTGQKLDSTDSKAVRASLLLKPTDQLQSLTIYDYYHNAGTPGAARLYFVNTSGKSSAVEGGSFLSLSKAVTAQAVSAFNQTLAQRGDQRWNVASAWNTGINDPFHKMLATDVENFGLLNDTTYEFSDMLKVRNIAAYRHSQTYQDTDYSGGNYLAIGSSTLQTIHQFSEELQLLGTSFAERLEWVAGGYYMEENGSENFISRTFLNPVASNIIGGGISKNISGFAQGTYKVTDDLKATAGLRYNVDEVSDYDKGINLAATSSLDPRTSVIALSCRERATLTSPLFPLAACLIQNSATFYKPTWTFSLEYSVPKDVLPAARSALLYVTNRRGYRAGGYNIRAATPLLFGPYQDEVTTDYEGGFKADWHFGQVSMRTNAAIYYDQIDGMQRAVNIPVPGVAVAQQVINNASSAHVYGAEFEWTVIPLPNVEFTGYYNYTKSQYDSYKSLDAYGMPIDLSGRTFPFTPENKLSLTARYSLPIPSNYGDLSAMANWVWEDTQSLADQPLADGSRAIQPAYGLWNFRVDWNDIASKSVDASLWVKNAFGKYYNAGFSDLSQSIGVALVLPGEPRTYGVTLRYHF